MRAVVVALGATLVAAVTQLEGVAAQAVRGGVVDGAGVPIAGALVFVRTADGTLYADTTGSQGRFALDSLPGGSHEVRYRALGFAPRTFSLILSAEEARDLGTISLERGPAPTATFLGVVQAAEPTNLRLEGAVVEINGEPVAVSGQAGSFRANDVAVSWGPNQIRVRHDVPSAVESSGIIWIADANEVHELLVTLQASAFPIDTVSVVADAAAPTLGRMEAFYRRQRTNPGHFMTREDLNQGNPRRLTDALRRVPGTRFMLGPGGELQYHFARLQSVSIQCPAPAVYVDGMFIGGGPDDYIDFDELLDIDEVAAIEAYGSVAQIPVELNRTAAGCGVIVIWTR